MSWFKRKTKSTEVSEEPIVREKIKVSFDMSIDFQKIVNAHGIVQYQIMGAAMPLSAHLPCGYDHFDYTHMYLCADNPYDFCVHAPKRGHTYYSIGLAVSGAGFIYSGQE